MRYATMGPTSLQDWFDQADTLARFFFNNPRRRPMQQAALYAARFPDGLS